MKKISLLFLLALSMSCTAQRMKLGFDEDLDPEKFGDRLNTCEVEFAKAIYDNDAQQAAAIVNSASKRKAIDINKYINAQRWNKPGQLPFLLFATFQDRPAIVELILDNTWGESAMQGIASVNQRSRGSKRTALHMAAERDYGEVVAVLLDRGAAVNPATTKGETPLHLALDSNCVAIAEVLLDKGADINARTTKERKTPLHLAAEKNLVNIVKILLDKGADVNVATGEGKTALHVASENNCEGVVRLLKDTADHQVEDSQGRTPLALARRAGHEAAIKILEEKSCRRICIAGAAECDKHCDGCPDCSCFGCDLNCGCFKAPCSFVCKTLCCAWSCCHPLREDAVHAPPSGSTSNTPPNPMQQPLPGNATMQR